MNDLVDSVRTIRRDALVANFRRQVYASWQGDDGQPLILFPHQAEWQLAGDGWSFADRPPRRGDYYHDIMCVADTLGPDALRIGPSRLINNIPCFVVRRAIVPRPGGVARILADLAAFKSGKSFGTAAWTAGFACLPDAKVHLVGAEYATAEPEFNYLIDFLCSERGMNMRYSKLHNDPRGGRMILKLRTGAEFQVKSWDNKDSLKGKRITAYVYVEAYQLPGLEVYTSLSQNLREMHGWALFPTTPDRPWVSIFHDKGHGDDPYWHCTCSVDARENPYTYDQAARDRDDPAKSGIMTRERYAIAWKGQLGVFVGRVYDFVRGDGSRYFTPETHPRLWRHTDDVWTSGSERPLDTLQ